MQKDAVQPSGFRTSKASQDMKIEVSYPRARLIGFLHLLHSSDGLASDGKLSLDIDFRTCWYGTGQRENAVISRCPHPSTLPNVQKHQYDRQRLNGVSNSSWLTTEAGIEVTFRPVEAAESPPAHPFGITPTVCLLMRSD